MKKIIISILIVLVFLLEISYAWFNFTKIGETQRIITGSLYLVLEDKTDAISLTNVYPLSVEEARARNDNVMTFSVSGKNTSSSDNIYYEIMLNNGDEEENMIRFNPEHLVFDLIEITEENGQEVETYLLDAVSFPNVDGRRIWVDTVLHGTNEEVERTYKLRMWLSDKVLISDSDPNADYTAHMGTSTDFKNHYASVKIAVIGDLKEKDVPRIGSEKLLEAIANKQESQSNSCNPIWVDTIDNEESSDDITYLSGSNDCVDMNYVWYSGKIWRIISINPDGTMKMITNNTITSIEWGTDVEYAGSWVYQWLNEDFYDTLVRPDFVVKDDAVWNYSTNSNTNTRPESIETQKTIQASVGLINSYEYNSTMQNSSASENYLNCGDFWWTITPYNVSSIRNIRSNGAFNKLAPRSRAYGVRPSIVIKSGLYFIGDGTKDNPYKIIGDKDLPSYGETLISSRSVGEYVKFDNSIYRIVEINTDLGTTKLNRVDFLRDENNDIITKNVASTIYYGKNDNTQQDTFWDYYLNYIWYENMSSNYKQMLVNDVYYLGRYVTNNNYKSTVCDDSSLDSKTIKNCNKYDASDSTKVFVGKVGIPRAGEMFSTQNINRSYMWTLTPYSNQYVNFINGTSNFELFVENNSTNLYGVRPSITLKDGIKIINGNGYVGGETNSPFEISE